MALIILDPMDSNLESVHVGVFSTIQFLWNTTKRVGSAFCCAGTSMFDLLSRLIIFIFYNVYIYLPIWLQYRLLDGRIQIAMWRISWEWWLTMIAALWVEPPLPTGKMHNGTYWMHVREDLYNLKAEFSRN